jgi:hypothetical protein
VVFLILSFHFVNTLSTHLLFILEVNFYFSSIIIYRFTIIPKKKKIIFSKTIFKGYQHIKNVHLQYILGLQYQFTTLRWISIKTIKKDLTDYRYDLPNNWRGFSTIENQSKNLNNILKAIKLSLTQQHIKILTKSKNHK